MSRDTLNKAKRNKIRPVSSLVQFRAKLLIDKETRGREIRRKKPKETVNDREKWRNRAVCKCKGMQVNRKSAGSGCQSLSALFCC